jgi:hypothetical protein
MAQATATRHASCLIHSVPEPVSRCSPAVAQQCVFWRFHGGTTSDSASSAGLPLAAALVFNGIMPFIAFLTFGAAFLICSTNAWASRYVHGAPAGSSPPGATTLPDSPDFLIFGAEAEDEELPVDFIALLAFIAFLTFVAAGPEDEELAVDFMAFITTGMMREVARRTS